MNRSDLKDNVQQFLKTYGTFKVGIASPSVGFEKAIKGCHPLDVMEDAKSIIVFAVYMGADYYRTIKIRGKKAGESRVGHIYRDWLAHGLAEFLRAKAFRSVVPSGFYDRDRKIARLSSKLAAHEAGIGVYGKPGIIVTPEYGPSVNLGVVLTNAVLQPDEKLNINPCQDCHVCVKVCPSRAVQGDRSPPTGYNREKCLAFIDKLRSETGDTNFLCGYCYDLCPVGKTRKRGYSISRQARLLSLSQSQRQKLIERVRAL